MPPRKHSTVFVNKATKEALKFYFDHTLSAELRGKWEDKIKQCGGEVVASDLGADFVLVARNVDKTKRQLAYRASTDVKKQRVVVADLVWLSDCVSRKELNVPSIKPQAMPGYGRKRVEFTAEDDDHLARYIARLLPDPESGGRASKAFYEGLVELGRTEPEFSWACRHTWESWKERYKKRRDELDPKIEMFVRKYNPKREHGWTHDRRVNDQRARHANELEDSDEDSEEVELVGDETGPTEEDTQDDRKPGPGGAGFGGEGKSNPRNDNDRHSDHEGNNSQHSRSPPPWEDWPALDHHPPHKDAGGEPQNRADTMPTSSPHRHGRPSNRDSTKSAHAEALERRRRHSFEAEPNKRPRLASEPAEAQLVMKARRPAQFIPASEESSSEETSDDDISDDPPNIHQPKEEEEEEQLPEVEIHHEVHRPSAASGATMSTMPPTSGDRTLVASSHISPKSKSVAQLSSASGGGRIVLDEQVQIEVLQPNDEPEEEDNEQLQEEQEVDEILTDNEALGMDVDKDNEDNPVIPEELPVSPHAPTATTARNRRKRAEKAREVAARSSPVPLGRVTRSRSRSVDPTFASLQSQPRRNKGKARAMEPETIEEEVDWAISPNGSIADLSRASHLPQPETLEEEEDVLKMVITDDVSSRASNIAEYSTTLSHREDHEHARSSDDEQIVEKIAAQVAVVKAKPRTTDALLSKLMTKEARSKTRPSLPIQLALQQPAKKLGGPSSRKPAYRQPSTPTPAITKAPGGTKGRTLGRQRAGSAAGSDGPSSDETSDSIPMPGTKAKAYQMKVEEEVLRVPYTPPTGTKAASLLEQQERQAPRPETRRTRKRGGN